MKIRNKQFIMGLLFIITLMTVLSGCSSSNDPKETNATKANTAVSDASKDGNKPDTAKKTPRVAFVYIGPPGDGGWTYQHDQGRKYMEEQTGIKADTVENVP